MAADPSGQDPKALWKELEPETDPVTLDQIHAIARKLDRKARLALIAFLLVVIVAAFAGGQRWQTTHDALTRTNVLLIIGGLLLSGYLSSRVLFPSRDPSEPAGAYLRRRLQRSLANVRGGWMITVTPLLPSLVLSFYAAYGRHLAGPYPGPTWARFLPLAVLAGALVFVLARTRRGERRIRAQLEEVDQLLKS